MKKLLLIIMLIGLSSCAGKPQTMRLTNFHSHAAVTGACTAVGIAFLRVLDVPSPWNEVGSAVACTAAVSIYKEGIKDSVWDHGDVIANGAGAFAVGFSVLSMEW